MNTSHVNTLTTTNGHLCMYMHDFMIGSEAQYEHKNLILWLKNLIMESAP